MAHGREELALGLIRRFRRGLGFAKLCFGVALIGDVGMDAYPFTNATLVVKHGDGANGEETVDAIVPADAVLVDKHAALGDAAVPFFYPRLRVLRVHGLGPAEALVLLVALAGEGGPALLLALHLADGIVGPNDVPHGFDRRAEPLLAVAQALFRVLAGGYVEHDAGEAHRLAVLILEGAAAGCNPVKAAILREDAILFVEIKAVTEALSDLFANPSAIIRVDAAHVIFERCACGGFGRVDREELGELSVRVEAILGDVPIPRTDAAAGFEGERQALFTALQGGFGETSLLLGADASGGFDDGSQHARVLAGGADNRAVIEVHPSFVRTSMPMQYEMLVAKAERAARQANFHHVAIEVSDLRPAFENFGAEQ